MNFKDFLHPYEHSLHEILRFTAEFRNKKEMTADEVINTFGVDFFAGKTDGFKVKVKLRKGIPFSLVKKAARNVKIFKLQKIYNEHKNLVEEMVAGATLFSETHIDTIYQGFQGSLFSSREEVIRLLTNNFAATDDMHKRPFSKLTKDIYAEFGIQYSTF